MGPIWATRKWANPYWTHAEPSCTPHKGSPYGTHIGGAYNNRNGPERTGMGLRVHNPGLAKCRQISIFAMSVAFTGKYWQIMENTGKYDL